MRVQHGKRLDDVNAIHHSHSKDKYRLRTENQMHRTYANPDFVLKMLIDFISRDLIQL